MNSEYRWQLEEILLVDTTFTIHRPISLGRHLKIEIEVVLRFDRIFELNESHAHSPAIIRPVTAAETKIRFAVRHRWHNNDSGESQCTVEMGQDNVTGPQSSHIVVKVSMATLGVKFWRPEVLPEYLITPRLILIHPPVGHDRILRRHF